jgi:hypothetical protein
MFYCTACSFVTEGDSKPSQCRWCSHKKMGKLTLKQFTKLLDAGEVVYCEACQLVHSGPVSMLNVKEVL